MVLEYEEEEQAEVLEDFGVEIPRNADVWLQVLYEELEAVYAVQESPAVVAVQLSEISCRAADVEVGQENKRPNRAQHNCEANADAKLLLVSVSRD